MSVLLARAGILAKQTVGGGGGSIPTTNLALWLKADAITGKSDGDAVSSWADSSGNARDATQATGGSQPLYKTGILNGLPAVRMDGSDDYLVATDAANFFTGTGAMFFIVAKRRSAVGNAAALVVMRTDAGNDYNQPGYALIGYEGGSNTEQQIYRDGAGSSMGSNAGNATLAISAWFDGSNNTIRVNGVSASPSADTRAFGADHVFVGCRNAGGPVNFSAYDYCEVIAYTAYDATIKSDVQTYLASKYAITV